MKNALEKLILITGSTDGLGKGTAMALAEKGARVILHGRDATKLERTANDIRMSTGNKALEGFLADLSSLAEVRRLANEIRADHDHLDVLINNAGVGFGEPGSSRDSSKDGHELRFAVNYLAPFLLTNLLIPILRQGASSRIVNVASAGQEPVNFDDVMLTKDYNGVRAYRQSKTALVMFTFDLAARLIGEGITVNCLHPGTYMDTKMVREARIAPRNSVQMGIDAVVYLATSPELEGITGRYFDRKEEAKAIAQAYDSSARRKLRILSEKLTGMNVPVALHSPNKQME